MWETDNSTYGKQLGIIVELCDDAKRNTNDFIKFSMSDLEDIVINGNYSKPGKELQTILNTFNTEKSCSIPLKLCKKYGTC